MKFVWSFLGLIVIIAAVSGFPADQQAVEDVDSFVTDEEWEEYKQSYAKNYPDKEEDTKRRNIYTKTKKQITEHNKKYEEGTVTYKQGINRFADYTDDEKHSLHGVLLSPRSKKHHHHISSGLF